MLLGSLVTLALQQSYKMFSVRVAPCLKNNATKTKTIPKPGGNLVPNSVEKENLPKCRFYVAPNGQCIHKNHKCCGMKNPQELSLCTKCFG